MNSHQFKLPANVALPPAELAQNSRKICATATANNNNSNDNEANPCASLEPEAASERVAQKINYA